MTVINFQEVRLGIAKKVREIFTEEEIKLARRLCDKHLTPAAEIEKQITSKAIDRINEKAAQGQGNDPQYWAYMLEGFCKGMFDK